MNNILVLYNADGSLSQIVQCPDDGIALQIPPPGGGMLFLTALPTNISSFLSQNYVLNGAITAKTVLHPTVSKTTFSANGTDEVTIGKLPIGAVASVSGAVTAGPETLTESELILTSTTTGSILVSITNGVPYLPWSTTLNAV